MAGMKRSKYICPYCAERFDGPDLLKGHVISEHGSEPLPKPEGSITLIVNGQRHDFQVEPNVTLYALIHDRMGLTGAKMFCDRGACGSCTVIMDGRPDPLLHDPGHRVRRQDHRDGRRHRGQAKHPLIETYVKHHAMQCGYCTPGFVVTAKALLDRNPDPTEEEIREALSGNLCRCGTYPQHPKAVAEAAKILQGG